MWPYLLELFLQENSNLLDLEKYFDYSFTSIFITVTQLSWFNIPILIPTLITHLLYQILIGKHLGPPIDSDS